MEKNFTPKGLEERPKKSVYSYPRLKWLSLANKHFFYDYQKKDNKIITLHAKNKAHLKLFYGGFVALDRVFLSTMFPNPKPDLSNRLRDRLLEIYRNDTDQLAKLLGWDLMMWKK